MLTFLGECSFLLGELLLFSRKDLFLFLELFLSMGKGRFPIPKACRSGLVIFPRSGKLGLRLAHVFLFFGETVLLRHKLFLKPQEAFGHFVEGTGPFLEEGLLVSELLDFRVPGTWLGIGIRRRQVIGERCPLGRSAYQIPGRIVRRGPTIGLHGSEGFQIL